MVLEPAPKIVGGGGLGRAQKPRAPAREAHVSTHDAAADLRRVGLGRQRHLVTEPLQPLNQIAPQPLRFPLTDELRLNTLVILSRPAPQPAAGDSAVAQPTTTPFTGFVRAPEPIGDMPPRHIPRPTSLRTLHCVPSGVVVRAWLPEPCPAATGDSGFTIETGSKSPISINRSAPG